MFYTEVANVLQFFSLPMELLGILLALIEIRYRKVAEFFRQHILGTWAEITDGFFAGVVRGQRRTTRRNPLWLNVLGMLVAVAAVAWLVWQVARAPASDQVFFIVLLVVLILVPLALGPMIRWLLRAILRFIGTFAQGREIGTLGLIIAMLGLTAEAYQFGEAIQQVMGIPAPELAPADSPFVRSVEAFAIALVMLVVIASYGTLIYGLVCYWWQRDSTSPSE